MFKRQTGSQGHALPLLGHHLAPPYFKLQINRAIPTLGDSMCGLPSVSLLCRDSLAMLTFPGRNLCLLSDDEG